MAVNYHKHGYSTTEVAQILGCSRGNVVAKINSGQLECNKAYTGPKGTRPTIVIEREQLCRYLKKHHSLYPKELLAAYKIYMSTPSETCTKPTSHLNAVDTLDDLLAIKNPNLGEAHVVIKSNHEYFWNGNEWEVNEDYKAVPDIPNATSVPTGAWASLLSNENKEESEPEPESEPEQEIVERPRKYYGYSNQYEFPRGRKERICSIQIDGRIAVANITEGTARDIFNALLYDSNIKMKSIQIVFD